ncbi:MAG: bifunctional pyr operon transcriptional regulator/uracil phosphoribosyltransferase PyrR [Candidatus Competibacteraceae bacterium]|nr:bifunctional pyr operon transcriptional regulator/uracil phosphoribosyltransferase PyrR [Candidatus Competibacteraceae bacterium]
MYDVTRLIQQMADALAGIITDRAVHDPALVGVHTGGVWVAEGLRPLLKIPEPVGTLDVSFYRDDFARVGVRSGIRPSELPFDVEGRHLILVDDVLHTGRTIRAALGEIFDYGRPASVLLATLVDRGGRQLPIAADIVGLRLELAPGESIKLTGPEPLELTLQPARES